MKQTLSVITGCFILLAISTLFFSLNETNAQQMNPEQAEWRGLLEKGLTIYELERGLTHIEERRDQLQAQLQEMNESIANLQHEIERQSELSGSVLRQYYMGGSNEFLSILLNVESLPELLSVLTSIQILLDADKKQLQQHQANLAEERRLVASLHETERVWSDLAQTYTKELERLQTIQAEYDNELAANADAATVEAEMIQLTKRWEAEGLPLFQKYFRALAQAIAGLPDWLLKQDGILTISKEYFTVELSDRHLNHFLQETDEMFEHFDFQFTKENILVEGSWNDVTLEMSGRYVLADEEQPVRISFLLDSLYYQQFLLPDTTRQALSEQFDLSLYPDKMSPFLKLKKFEQKDGALIFYFQF